VKLPVSLRTAAEAANLLFVLVSLHFQNTDLEIKAFTRLGGGKQA
jgi:hypothetical protein